MRSVLPTEYRGLKPPVSFELNHGHPLARDLRGFWLLNDSGQTAFEYVRGYPSVLKAGSALAWRPTPYGTGVLLDGTNPIRTNAGSSDAPDAFTQPGYPLTIAGLCRPDSLSVVNCLYGTQANGNPANYAGANLTIQTTGTIQSQVGNNGGVSSGNRRSKVSTLTVPGAGVFTTIGASFRSNSDISLYIDGKDAGGTTSGTGTGIGYNSSNAGAIAAIANNAPGFTGVIVWVGLWARNLTADEHMQLTVDPYCVFTARPLSISPGVATSISGSDAGTLSEASSISATLSSTEAGSATDVGLVGGITNVSSSDTAAAAEAGFISVAKSDLDTATLTDVGVVTAIGITDSDTFSFSEFGTNTSGGGSSGSVNATIGVCIGFNNNAFDTDIAWTRIDQPAGVR